MKKTYIFKNNESLLPLATELLKDKNVEAILMDGELGAGKTTLTKEIGKLLNETKTIISPTFNTLLIYDHLVHIDAYKLKGSINIYEEFFDGKLVIIEWASNINHNFDYYYNINVKLDKNANHIFEVELIDKREN